MLYFIFTESRQSRNFHVKELQFWLTELLNYIMLKLSHNYLKRPEEPKTIL